MCSAEKHSPLSSANTDSVKQGFEATVESSMDTFSIVSQCDGFEWPLQHRVGKQPHLCQLDGKYNSSDTDSLFTCAVHIHNGLCACVRKRCVYIKSIVCTV